MSKNLDSRQLEHRSTLDRLSSEEKPNLKTILPNLNTELTPVFALSESATPDLVLNIGPATVQNSDTGLTRSFSPISQQYFQFTGGTITFPSSNGTITVNPGTNGAISIPDDTFVAVLVQINSIGEMSVSVGQPAATANDTTLPGNFPAPNSSDLAIGFVILENIAGTFQAIENSDITQFQAGGGSGGSGSSAGLQPAEGFESLFFDDLSAGLTSPDNKLDGKTTGSHKAGSGMYELLCDKSVLATTVGTALTLNSGAGFTVVENDIVVINNEVRRIVTVTDQTNMVMDSALSSDATDASCLISQAVYTVDIVNFGDDTELTRLRDIYPDESISQANLIYFDSLSEDDGVDDFTQEARIAAVLSNQGLQTDTAFPTMDQFGSIFKRGTVDATQPDYVLPAAGGQRLYAVFFANPDNSSVTSRANLTEYRLSLIDSETSVSGDLGNSVIGRSGAGSYEGMTVSVVGGKTRIVLDFEYPAGAFSGKSQGAVEVIVDGRKFARLTGAVTVDDYYEEINNTTIDLDQDYSASDLPIEVIYRQALEDASADNSFRVGQLESYNNIQSSEFDTGKRWINGEIVYGIAVENNTDQTVNGAVIATIASGLEPINAIQFNTDLWSIATFNSDGTNRSGIRYNSANGEITLFKSGTDDALGPIRLFLEYIKP